jgi:hypothetical protein
MTAYYIGKEAGVKQACFIMIITFLVAYSILELFQPITSNTC